MASTEPMTPGTRIGRYEVIAHLATGGMGEVYKAQDTELGRVVALKVLPARQSENTTAVERFRREARHAARLSHKNIVTLYDWGQDAGTWFLALEFIDGIDLNTHINARGHLDPQEAWLITVQAARALDHAFQQGITHRDVKPSNFLLARHGRKVRVKLTDLGVARAIRDEDYRVTRAGTTVGTLDYLAPEQARDSALADVRSDIYSLGCTLYHMLAGQPPFPDGGLGERLFKHLQVEPPDVRQFNPDVPDSLWAVLRRMLAKRPDDRYQTPAELLDALLRLSATAEGAPASQTPSPEDSEEGVVPPPTPTPIPEGTPAPRRRKRPSDAQSSAAPPADPYEGEVLGVTAEQRQVAARQFARACEVLASDNQEKSYAYELLVSCCKLDPANIACRRQLRQVGKELFPRGGVGRWLAPLRTLASKTRLKAARHAGDHRKVLEHGEAVLARAPEDVATHLDMAEAAARLNLTYLETWLLEQAYKEVPANAAVLRRLAGAYERGNALDRAVKVWENVRKVAPEDPEAPRKINALAAKSTIARGKYDG
jgi:serine/threonine protein kinase